MSEEKRALKGRLGAIIKSRKNTRVAAAVSAVLVVVVVGAAIALGAGWTAPSEQGRHETGIEQPAENNGQARIQMPTAQNGRQPIGIQTSTVENGDGPEQFLSEQQEPRARSSGNSNDNGDNDDYDDNGNNNNDNNDEDDDNDYLGSEEGNGNENDNSVDLEGFHESPEDVGIVRLPAQYKAAYYDDMYSVDSSEIKSAFPEAYAVIPSQPIPQEAYRSTAYSYSELAFITALAYSFDGTRNYQTLAMQSEVYFDFGWALLYIVDRNYGIQGVVYTNQNVVDGYIDIVKGNEGVDGGRLYSSVKSRLDESMKQYDAAEVTVGPVVREISSNGSESVFFPVYVNGAEIGSNHYMTGFWTTYSSLDVEYLSQSELIRRMMYQPLFESMGDWSAYRPRTYSPASEDSEIQYGRWLNWEHDVPNRVFFLIVFDAAGTVLGYTIIPTPV